MNPPLPSMPASIELSLKKQDKSWRALFKLITFHLTVWSAFTAIGTFTSLNDDLRAGLHPDLWEIAKVWARAAVSLSALSLIISACFSRWPILISSFKNLLIGYGILMLLIVPLQLGFVIQDYLISNDESMTLSVIQDQIKIIDGFSYILRLSSVSIAYVAVAALKIWQQTTVRRQQWEQERLDFLGLKLELEQQRMLALRAQLEPHFVFNALNAISALVMSDNKNNALKGLNGLSDLLRYALTASEKNWVKFQDELRFVEDYANLQILRYGARMCLSIEGNHADIVDVECPPLLLQPLIENAIRHDLERQHGNSQILLQFHHDEQTLFIQVSNAIHNESSPNPGAGLGLRNTRARLQLAYGDLASLETRIDNQRFIVDLRIPLEHA